MEIDTEDNPPVSQRPYSLALKHVEWVRQELEALEKAGVITRSVSPWASPLYQRNQLQESHPREGCVWIIQH